jgi:hypothetical protein
MGISKNPGYLLLRLGEGWGEGIKAVIFPLALAFLLGGGEFFEVSLCR